jgi:hypothetical protein
VVGRDQAAIGDGDPVGVARQIAAFSGVIHRKA